jgi:putative NADH-flavin reductase
MKLAIFGAAGRTGLQLVEQALEQGHHVTAFARRPPNAPQHERLSWRAGDVLDVEAVRAATMGQDAVLCAIGTSSNVPGTRVLSDGTANIVAGMRAAGVRRLVLETTMGIGDSHAQAPIFFFYVLVPLVLRHVFVDKGRQEDVVRASGLDWVIVRAARLTNGPRTGRYRVGTQLTVSRFTAHVSRADVADFMLKQVNDPSWVGQAPSISY